MRKFLGGFFFGGALGALGVYAANTHARDIQTSIAQDARAVVATARHDIRAAVSGRDISVFGTAQDVAELLALSAALEAVEGRRVVNMSGVDLLPVATPFELRATRDAAGATVLDGVIPTEDARAFLDALLGADAAAGLTLSSGAPDRKWTTATAIALNGLSALNTGALVVSDQMVTLTGVAANPAAAAAAQAEIDGLPFGYTGQADIELNDDGTPLRLTLTLADGAVSGAGKFPADLTQSAIADRFDGGDAVTLTQAVIPSADTQWPDMITTGMDALALLIDGELDVEANHVSLTGTGTPDNIAQAAALMEILSNTYEVNTDLSPWDDGAPVELTMTWDNTSATARGKFPADYHPRGPAGVAVEILGKNSFIPDETGNFTTNANAGITALGLMSSGTLNVSETSIALTGAASSPQVGIAMDAVLANAAPNTEISRDLTYLDDGSPAAWSLTYEAATGADIEGRLPSGMATDDIASALGLAEITGRPATALEDSDLGNSLDVLELIAGYLPEIESANYAREGTLSALDLVVSPGVDIDLVASDLAQSLPPNVAFSIRPLDTLPTDGSERTNATTGLTEVFSGGFWLPSLTFETDVAGCSAQTQSVFERQKIAFLSSSARLDATSIRTINALAAVAQACVAADLTLEVSGHTDATGDALQNDVLSQDRAAAVRAALIGRGVPAPAITAYGFGQTQPIADNSTAEGRAENRRTDITWYAAGAVREP